MAHAESNWNISVDSSSALAQVSKNGTKVFNAYYVFWGEKWKWSSYSNKFIPKKMGEYKTSIYYSDFDLKLEGETKKFSENQASLIFNFDAKKTSSKVIGGGLAFKLNTLAFKPSLGDPELLPNNTGWAWGKGQDRIEFKFNKPVAKLYFEPGGHSEIRVMFYSDEIPSGQLSNSAILSVSGTSSFTNTPIEHYSTVDSKDWIDNPLSVQKSLIDLSFLNALEKPAGKRGFLKTSGQEFKFEDGTTAKFWGTNVTAYALFGTSKDMIKLQAKRLSALGFNLVRFHHIDNPWVSPNIFGTNKATNTLTIDPTSIEKMDWWIKCLKDEGIYVWLDLHVDRAIKKEDGIDWIDEILKNKPSTSLMGYNYVNPSIEKKMMEFNTALLSHINPYTLTAYKDEPAIMGVLITNENDVTQHYGISLLPDKKVPNHSKAYMAKAEEFANQWKLPNDKVWRAWEAGPSKLFLNNLEHDFNVRMIKHLRTLGVKVPIATTNSWGEDSLGSLPALTDGDMIDVHAYQDLGAIDSNPSLSENFTHWIGAAQLVNRPTTVTEWNWSTAFTLDRHTLPLFAAANAGTQGWDAMMQFAYAQSPLREDEYANQAHQWDSFMDPSAISTMPAAALLFRQSHIKESSIEYVVNLSEDDLIYKSRSPKNSVAMRTALENGKLSVALPAIKELPWLIQGKIPANAIKINSLNEVQIDKSRSINSPIFRDWDKGVFTINTEKTQAAMGWIGGKIINLKDVSYSISNKNATVAVQSLDNNSISNSSNILISIGTVTQPNDKKRYAVEPIQGAITIKATKGLKLFKNNKESLVKYEAGNYKINLDDSNTTLWIYLKK